MNRSFLGRHERMPVWLVVAALFAGDHFVGTQWLAPHELRASQNSQSVGATESTETLDSVSDRDRGQRQPGRATGVAATETANRIADLIKQRGWLAALSVVFAAGLALNLTPCVYPMFAITLSYFGGRECRPAQAFLRALLYFLGIVLTYSSLGLVAALTGGLFGSLLQHRLVLISIAAVLVLMALSMFGLFEIRPPQSLLQKATGLSSKASYLGVFLLGAMVGVIAAPCVGPFLIGLLAFVAALGDPWIGGWLFLALAAGLGLPYLIMGTFSGLLFRLPRSGEWMVWVKRALGVLLLAVAAWLTHPLWGATPRTESKIDWVPYSSDTLEQAAANGQAVIIDFWASWCAPCHEMEKRTFSDERVIQASNQFVMLRADLTHTGSPEVEALVDQFEIRGVPTLIFIGPNGEELADLRLVGFVPPDELLEAMDNALGRGGSMGPWPVQFPAQGARLPSNCTTSPILPCVVETGFLTVGDSGQNNFLESTIGGG